MQLKVPQLSPILVHQVEQKREEACQHYQGRAAQDSVLAGVDVSYHSFAMLEVKLKDELINGFLNHLASTCDRGDQVVNLGSCFMAMRDPDRREEILEQNEHPSK